MNLESLIEFNEYELKFYKNNKKAIILINIACTICIICYLINIFSGSWWFIIPAILYLNAMIILCRTLKLTRENITKTEANLKRLKELDEKLEEWDKKDE